MSHRFQAQIHTGQFVYITIFFLHLHFSTLRRLIHVIMLILWRKLWKYCYGLNMDLVEWTKAENRVRVTQPNLLFGGHCCFPQCTIRASPSMAPFPHPGTWPRLRLIMRDYSENTWCCGIWQWTTLGWCYSIAREVQPRVQLSNTSQEWFIVKCHNNICSYFYHACWI